VSRADGGDDENFPNDGSTGEWSCPELVALRVLADSEHLLRYDATKKRMTCAGCGWNDRGEFLECARRQDRHKRMQAIGLLEEAADLLWEAWDR